jgi:hypothetical protein
MSSPIRIKPHHFVDILCALGRGQTTFEPHPYGHDLHTVAARLLQDPLAPLEIELGADDVCRPCRHNVDGQCNDTIDTSFRPDAPSSKQAYNLLIDRRWCQRLGLAQGDKLTALELCQRLGQHAGDITPIYCETPPDRTAKRADDLRAGIAKFLADEPTDDAPE